MGTVFGRTIEIEIEKGILSKFQPFFFAFQKRIFFPLFDSMERRERLETSQNIASGNVKKQTKEATTFSIISISSNSRLYAASIRSTAFRQSGCFFSALRRISSSNGSFFSWQTLKNKAVKLHQINLDNWI